MTIALSSEGLPLLPMKIHEFTANLSPAAALPAFLLRFPPSHPVRSAEIKVEARAGRTALPDAVYGYETTMNNLLLSLFLYACASARIPEIEFALSVARVPNGGRFSQARRRGTRGR